VLFAMMCGTKRYAKEIICLSADAGIVLDDPRVTETDMSRFCLDVVAAAQARQRAQEAKVCV
jgi:hypothetical protein